MKKFISLILLLALAFSLCACSAKKAEPEAPSAEPEAPSAEPEAPAVELTPAQSLLEAFKADTGTDSLELARALVSTLPFSGDAVEVEPGWLSGFDTELQGFERGVMFCPIIGSIPFVGYIFELGSDEDAQGFVDTLKAAANPRWNICVEADETVVEAVGQRVFFVMSPLNLT